jgi:hypothetical protein
MREVLLPSAWVKLAAIGANATTIPLILSLSKDPKEPVQVLRLTHKYSTIE